MTDGELAEEILTHLSDIANSLISPQVLVYFRSKKHLTEYEVQNIQSLPTKYEQNVALVDFLVKKQICGELVPALEATNQHRLAQIIKNTHMHSANSPARLELIRPNDCGRYSPRPSVDSEHNEKLLKIPVFGQQFALGTCYDARKCEMLTATEYRLWNQETIETQLRTEQCPSKLEEIIIEKDTLNAKLSTLSCGLNEKLNILAGLLGVSGSGKYVFDHKKIESFERIAFRFASQSFTSTLFSNNQELPKIDNSSCFSNRKATHVIIAIKYGFECYFVFDCEKGGKESLQSIVTKALSENDSEEQEASEDITCQYYGDALPIKSPNSFHSARKMIQDLRSSTLHQVVPTTIYLFPLAELNSDDSLLVNNLAEVFFATSEKQLQLFIEKRRQLRSMLQISEPFGEWLQREIKNRIARLEQAESEFRKQLKKLIEHIRTRGQSDSDEFETLMNSWHKSIFGEQALNNMIADYKRELDIITCIISDLDSHNVPLKMESRSTFSFKKRNKQSIELQLRFALYRGSDNEKLEAFFKNPPNGIIANSQLKPKWFENPNETEIIYEQLNDFFSFVAVPENAVNCDFVASFIDFNNTDDSVCETMTCVEIVRNKFGSSEKVIFPQLVSVNIDTNEASFATISWTTDEDNYKYLTKINVWLTNKDKNCTSSFPFPIDSDNMSKPLQINDLQSSTNYRIALQFVTCWGTMHPFDEQTVDFKTRTENRTFMFDIKLNSVAANDTKWKKVVLIPQRFEMMEARRVFDLETGEGEHKRIEQGGVRKFMIGGHSKGIQRDKVILLVGGTGFGKTTLLNCMANYLYGVNQEDDFRFRLVSEDEELQDDPNRDDTKSLTKWVTAYVLNNTKLDYRLTVVDTPGFNDTTGIKRDKEITELIHEWFKEAGPRGLDRLDAVCLVVKGSETKLTEAMQYVLNSVISLLANNMAENIVQLLTFCDPSLPPALAAIKKAGINSTLHFKFNNSAFFEDNDNDPQQKIMWCDAMENFSKFFSSLLQLKPQSLAMTNEVLEDRERIEDNVYKLESKTKSALNCLARMEKDLEAINKHKKDIDESQEFTFTTSKEVFLKTELKSSQWKAVNCATCKKTCEDSCFRCNLPPLPFKSAFCKSIRGKNDACSICKCNFSKHKLESFIYKPQIIQVTETKEELKEKYGSAIKGENQAQAMLENLAKEMLDAQTGIQEHVEMIQHCMKKLEKNAMFPKHITEISYIQTLIEFERKSQAPNWKLRVDQLNYQLGIASQIANATDPDFNPLRVYKDNYRGALQFLVDRYPKHQEWFSYIMPSSKKEKLEPEFGQNETTLAINESIFMHNTKCNDANKEGKDGPCNSVNIDGNSNPDEQKLMAFTRERIRERLRFFSDGIRQQVVVIIVLCEQMKAVKNNLRNIDDDSQHFIFFTRFLERKELQLPPGSHATKCMDCHTICHDRCKIGDCNEKQWCSVMELMVPPTPDQITTGIGCDGDGLLSYKPTAEQEKAQREAKCTTCPDRCLWSKHRDVPYFVEYKKKKKLVTAKQMNRNCNMKLDENNFSAIELLLFLGADFVKQDTYLAQLVSDIRHLNSQIDDSMMSDSAYLEKLLAEEQKNCTIGSLDRIDLVKRHIAVSKVAADGDYINQIHHSSKQYLLSKFELRL